MEVVVGLLRRLRADAACSVYTAASDEYKAGLAQFHGMVRKGGKSARGREEEEVTLIFDPPSLWSRRNHALR